MFHLLAVLAASILWLPVGLGLNGNLATVRGHVIEVNIDESGCRDVDRHGDDILYCPATIMVQQGKRVIDFQCWIIQRKRYREWLIQPRDSLVCIIDSTSRQMSNLIFIGRNGVDKRNVK